MRMRNLFVVLLVVMLLLSVGVASAQDAPFATNTPTMVFGSLADGSASEVAVDETAPLAPVSGVIPAPPVEDAVRDVNSLLVVLLGTTMSAPITVFLVSLLKRIRLLDNVPSQTLSMIVAAVLVAVVWTGRWLGLEVQVNSVFEAIQVAGPAVLQLILTLFGSSEAYALARKRDTAFIAYKRPPTYSGTLVDGSALLDRNAALRAEIDALRAQLETAKAANTSFVASDN